MRSGSDSFDVLTQEEEFYIDMGAGTGTEGDTGGGRKDYAELARLLFQAVKVRVSPTSRHVVSGNVLLYSIGEGQERYVIVSCVRVREINLEWAIIAFMVWHCELRFM